MSRVPYFVRRLHRDILGRLGPVCALFGGTTLKPSDTDGDRITISCDADLVEALERFDGTVFRVLVRGRRSNIT